MALSIMNYSCTESIPAGTYKAFYPVKPGTSDADTSDPDNGATVIIVEGLSPDRTGVYGSVRVITPNGVRDVDSLSVGVWVHEQD